MIHLFACYKLSVRIHWSAEADCLQGAVYMKRIMFIALIMGMAFISGCSDENEVIVSDRISEALPQMLAYDDVCSIYIKNDEIKKAMYEPNEGCYLGAYILSDRRVNYSISDFENAVKKEHCFYTYHITDEGKFPLIWLMECISKKKTPMFILDAKITEDMTKIEKFADSLAEYNVPIFLEINTYKDGYEKEDYVNFFRMASDTVKRKASNVAVIWGSEISKVYDAMRYYPGDEYVDWVGLTMYEKIGSDNTIERYSAEIEYFYQNFQYKKPVFISGLGVSHYTSYGHIYQNKNAAKEIKRLYNEIAVRYPRIKAVSYMDFNAFETDTHREEKDDFCLTDAAEILQAYRESIKNKRFISSLHKNEELKSQRIKTTFIGYMTGEGAYIPAEAVNTLWGISMQESYVAIVGDEKCYSADHLAKRLGKKASIENGDITID